MARQAVKKPRAPKKRKPTRMEMLTEAAAEFAGWTPGRQVLTPVRSVSTIFPQFDIATRVNGYPIQRVCLAHGPSNHGKTVFMLGLGRSFLERENFYFHVDAEMSTPDPWVVENLQQFADYPTFLGLRPESYEETAECVRSAAQKLRALRDAKKIPDDVTALFGIDSLQKLVPKDLLAKVSKTDVDGRGGRGGMFQAAMNTAWMRELIPLLYHCNAGVLLLGREGLKQNAQKFEKKYTVGGGNSPYYDSSLVTRVTRSGWVERKATKSAPAEVYGERHMLEIQKTKVGHKDAKVTRCFFHTSNGTLIPAGFDRVRDVLDLGLQTPVLKVNSKHEVNDQETGVVYGRMNEAVVELTNDLNTLNELQARVMAQAVPQETDEACTE